MPDIPSLGIGILDNPLCSLLIIITHLFLSIAIKTSGVFGPGAYILCNLAPKIKFTSNEPNPKARLFQQIYVMVQRDNAHLFSGVLVSILMSV